MRNLVVGLLAATAVALAMPANAQDVYVGAGPVGVGVDVDHHNDWRRHYDRDDSVVVHERHHHCHVTIIHDGDMTKKIRRCD